MTDLPLFESSVKVFDAHNLTTTATSSSVECKESEWVTIQVSATGASVSGTVQPQASCDGGATYANIGSSVNLESATNSIQTLAQGAYTNVQVVYTTASGTGSVTVIINQKR